MTLIVRLTCEPAGKVKLEFRDGEVVTCDNLKAAREFLDHLESTYGRRVDRPVGLVSAVPEQSLAAAGAQAGRVLPL